MSFLFDIEFLHDIHLDVEEKIMFVVIIVHSNILSLLYIKDSFEVDEGKYLYIEELKHATNNIFLQQTVIFTIFFFHLKCNCLAAELSLNIEINI